MSEEKAVEMEHVPLKSDTDAPAGTTEEVAAPAPQKKQWFFKKNKKTTSDVENPEVKTEEVNTEGPKKKCCWWNRGQKGEKEQKAEEISIGIDLVNRDEKGINEHVKFGFEDIFGEPDAQHSYDCTWRIIYKIFVWTRLFVYRLGAIILGIPSAIFIGIGFGLFTVLNVFACVPLAKLLTIPGNWIAKTWAWLIHALIDPVTTSLGLFFSSFTVRKYGFNSQVTEPLV